MEEAGPHLLLLPPALALSSHLGALYPSGVSKETAPVGCIDKGILLYVDIDDSDDTGIDTDDIVL